MDVKEKDKSKLLKQERHQDITTSTYVGKK